MKLICTVCRKEKEITEEDFMRYLSCGWPVCHGEAMELITDRRI